MEIVTSILKLFAGIGLFLFAMYLLEESLKNLSGRKFKLFLQRITRNKLGAVTGGALVTAVLQSSSMVSLMVLAFVGAGVFTMKNALALILGANLGTTIDSWLVATLGFKTSIEVIAYPAVFIAGLLIILFGKRKYVTYTAYFLFGFGLLFIGLSFMKTAMEEQVKTFDFSHYAEMSLLVFLGIGFLITLLVQSSSVTMALTLTALHAGAISFPAAAAIVLGSETGTTIKIMLSGIGGTASKKRVVLGNLLFNIFLTLFAFILLHPILSLITDYLHISDPLIALVTFSSFINLVSIILFLPFLNPFSRFLERFFKETDGSAAAFIGNASIEEPQTALDLYKMETAWFLHNAMHFNLRQLQLDTGWMEEEPGFKSINSRKKITLKTPEEQYEFLKLLQGEMQLFYLSLRTRLTDESYLELTRLAASARSGMHAAKSIKDIGNNISNLANSSQDIKFDLFVNRKKQTETFYILLDAIIKTPGNTSFDQLQEAFAGIRKNYHDALSDFYSDAQTTPIEGMDMTTAISFNRELFASGKAMLLAVKDYVLDEEDALKFNERIDNTL